MPGFTCLPHSLNVYDYKKTNTIIIVISIVNVVSIIVDDIIIRM